ncbi:MAG: TonB-dependent receptor, partial [Vicinamibacterales bacterium]
MFKRVARVFGLAVVSGCLASAALAQGGNAVINGTIFDQARAVLPGAAVTVTNEATGITREAVTGSEGRFILPTLTPGTYTIRVELPGFQVQTRQGVVLQVGQELTIDFTLPLATVAETITVSGTAPVVEVTTSRVGTNVTTQEIDNLPSAGRSSLSLMQLVPGLTPSLAPGTFEGGQFNANGRDTGSNLFMVDGVYNNDERNGGAQGDQARISLDTMAEFQVLTHQYTAEFGGSSGVVVNAVTRSGTNQLSGRAFYYFQDDKLTATDPFLKARGESNPDSGSDVYGFGAGGPIVRNKAFWFFNLERNVIEQAVQLTFPAEAAPLAVSYSDAMSIKSLNTFLRGDYHASPANNFSFRWAREAAPTIGENWEENLSTRDNVFIEQDAGDQLFSGNWTAILGNRATNEVKVTHVREDLLQGNLQYFDDSLNFIELNGRDQFDIGSDNRHPDFAAGPRASHGSAKGRTSVIDETFTFVKGGWAGDHTFKAGAAHNWTLVRPQIVGGNDNGTFTFRHNRPFDPANPRTYPSRFSIRLGQIYFDLTDRRSNAFVQDKWQLNRNLTLNLGVRYDYQTLTPQTKDAFAPRTGFAYDPTGSGRTVIRGGIGKFYEYHLAGVSGVLQQQAVISPSFMFDTGEDRSADTGLIPTQVCLQPSGSGGLAVIGPACRAFLANLRNQVNAGGFVNNEPTVDGDRRMGYLWSFSVGVQRELFPAIGLSVDYIGNRGRDQTALIDINEGPPGPDGRATRRGVNAFDPNGTLIPAAAR